MPSSSLWSALRAALHTWTTLAFPQATPDPDAWFAALRKQGLVSISEHLDTARVAHLPQRDVLLALALVALGPQEAAAGDPPTAMWHTLCAYASNDVPEDDADRWLEIVVAWGCGWRRDVAPTSTGWDGEWQRAVLALCTLVAGSVHATMRQLVQRLAYGSHSSSEVQHLLTSSEHEDMLRHVLSTGTIPGPLTRSGELGLYAAEIALELLRNDPQSTPAAHRLATWNPARHRLRAFVAEAVRGQAQRDLKASAFTCGMLYPLLAADCGLRVDTVVFNVCHAEACNAALVQQAVQHGVPPRLEQMTRGLYEQGCCPHCQTPADDCQTYRIARRHWFLLPLEYGGAYVLRQFWHCPGCGNLFPVSASYRVVKQQIREMEDTLRGIRQEDDPLQHADKQHVQQQLKHARAQLKNMNVACPLCHHPRPQRMTSAWVFCPAAAVADADQCAAGEIASG